MQRKRGSLQAVCCESQDVVRNQDLEVVQSLGQCHNAQVYCGSISEVSVWAQLAQLLEVQDKAEQYLDGAWWSRVAHGMVSRKQSAPKGQRQDIPFKGMPQ